MVKIDGELRFCTGIAGIFVCGGAQLTANNTSPSKKNHVCRKCMSAYGNHNYHAKRGLKYCKGKDGIFVCGGVLLTPKTAGSRGIHDGYCVACQKEWRRQHKRIDKRRGIPTECAFCKQIFLKNHNHYIYCSRKCCNSARQTILSKTCEECGITFYRQSNLSNITVTCWNGRRFCSYKCSNTAMARLRGERRRLNAPPTPSKTCVYCKNTFLKINISNPHWNSKKFCSILCWKAWCASPEGRQHLSQAGKIGIQKAMRSREYGPSKLEQRGFAIFLHYGLPLEFIGDQRDFRIGRLFPDFINKELKIVIEIANKSEKMFRHKQNPQRAYLHLPSNDPTMEYWKQYEIDRINYYSKFGYSCVVLWDDIDDESMVELVSRELRLAEQNLESTTRQAFISNLSQGNGV